MLGGLTLFTSCAYPLLFAVFKLSLYVNYYSKILLYIYIYFNNYSIIYLPIIKNILSNYT